MSAATAGGANKDLFCKRREGVGAIGRKMEEGVIKGEKEDNEEK